MKKLENAKFGVEAFANEKEFPAVFPRVMGPNTANYVQEVIESGLTSNMVARFEAAFADAMGVKHCVSAPGCTNALHILAAALEFEPGAEVIVSPIADYGTVMGLIRENYIPVFCDTAPGSPNLSAETIERCITRKTRAVVVVHKMGVPCDMAPIVELAEKHGLLLFEDVCQAVFSEYNGRLTGTFGHAAAYSFDSEKSMGSDMGGCIITDDDEFAERWRYIGVARGAKVVPGFGRTHFHKGLALRMPQCTAAVCLGQLEIIREQVKRRDAMARLLTSKLQELEGVVPLRIPESCTVFSCWMYGFSVRPHMFTCDPADLADKIKARGLAAVGVAKYYLMPQAIEFLRKDAANSVYPFSLPDTPDETIYQAERQTPNAKAFLDTFIRWAWTEKYTEEHVDRMFQIIKETVQENLKR